MFGSIVRLFDGSLAVRDHIRLFEHQVKNLVSRGPHTGQDCEPSDEEHVRCHSKLHMGEYSRIRTIVNLDNEDTSCCFRGRIGVILNFRLRAYHRKRPLLPSLIQTVFTLSQFECEANGLFDLRHHVGGKLTQLAFQSGCDQRSDTLDVDDGRLVQKWKGS